MDGHHIAGAENYFTPVLPNADRTEVSNVCYGQFYMTGLIILLEVRCTFCMTK